MPGGMLSSLPGWLGWALALGMFAFVFGFMVISRDGRFSTNVSALVFGEPGALGVGVGLIAASFAVEVSFGTTLLLVGAAMVVLAGLSWFTEGVEI